MFFHISFYSNKRLWCRKERERRREAGERESEQILLREYNLKKASLSFGYYVSSTEVSKK